MDRTSASLLERLRQPHAEAAWTRFVELYTPLLLAWAKRRGIQDGDAADLIQDVFALLLRKLPEFTYDPSQSFRAWLRAVTLNRWRELQRRRIEATTDGSRELEELPAPQDDAAFWDVDYHRHLLQSVLPSIQGEFQPQTWKAGWETLVAGRATAEVAAELGMKPGAVRVAKCRVVNRLREELKGLLD